MLARKETNTGRKPLKNKNGHHSDTIILDEIKEDTPEARARHKMMQDPEYRKRQELTDSLRRKEVIRHSDLDVPEGESQPHFQLKLPSKLDPTLSSKEERLVLLIDTLIKVAQDETRDIDDEVLDDELRNLIKLSQQIEKDISHVHVKAAHSIQNRFYVRLIPLFAELKKLNGIR